MSIQNVQGWVAPEGKLGLQWEIVREVVAISVQIAKDVEFMDTPRTFVLPPVKGIALDTGKGDWYYRVGAWVGDKTRGVIEWSGMYGPLRIETAKPVVSSEPAKLKIQHVQPALDSLIFHTGLYEPYYVVVDYTDSHLGLRASTAKTVYLQDQSRGQFHVLNLSAASVYSFRVTTFIGERATLPVGGVKQLGDGLLIGGKRPARASRPGTNTDMAVYAADKAILRGASEKENMRFSSYAEYMQFIAAKARTTERRQGV
jgi:hypothetical protein